MKMNKIVVLVLALAAPCLNAFAGTLISTYPHASLVEEDNIAEKDYRIAIGSVDVVNNAVRVSKELRMDVTGTAYLYRVAEGYTSKNAIDFVNDQLKSRQAEILYHCSSRGCGDSNSWANVIFRKSKLYGKEIDQNYIAAKFSQLPGAPVFLAYSARRGNGQVFLYLEELRDANNTEATDVAGITNTARLLIAIPVDNPDSAALSTSEATLSEIQRLASDPQITLWVVSHYGLAGQSLADAMDHSNRALQNYIRQLAASGVNTALLKSVAVGAFADLKSTSPGVIKIYSESNAR